MGKQISPGLKIIFLVHTIISLILGLGLWVIPGRFLTLLGWVPEWIPILDTSQQVPGTTLVDPFITRLLGSALLALAYASFQGYRKSEWIDVAILVQLEVVFCVLGLIGMIWSLIPFSESTQGIAYLMMVMLAGFAVAWIWALIIHNKE